MCLAPYSIPYLKHYKNGKVKLVKVSTIKWFDSPHRTVPVTRSGEYQKLVYTLFNPGSRHHIIRWMEEDFGYKFPFYTAKGSPKADADSLGTMDHPAGKMLKRYLKLGKDQSQLSEDTKGGWLRHYRQSSHSIHHRVDLIGAVTHRASHSSPNLAQVPAGKAFRELFKAPPNHVIVGADLKNIELRVLAHYLAPHDGGKYAEAVLSKDMHWFHAGLAGFIDNDGIDYDEHNPIHKAARNLAKQFVFGWLYGQGDTIRGSILWADGCLPEYTKKEYESAKKKVERRIVTLEGGQYFPIKKDKYVVYDELLILQTIYGKRVADTFLERVEGIKDLIKDCQLQSKQKGSVTAIDGRELTSKSQHSALNLLLQGSAGVIAKKWMVNYHTLADSKSLPHGGKWFQNAFVHDEFQCSCSTPYATTLGDIMVEGCLLIQGQFSMSLPIEADYQIGLNWSQTH